MRITLIDNLTIIAHSQHENQNDDSLAKLLVIIPYVQYFSLLLPTHGWNFWTYSDGYLNFFQKASSYFTITPFFEFQSSFIYYPFTILTLILIIGLFIYLSCFSLQTIDDDKIIYQEGKSSTLCSFLLFVIQTLQIPCYKFYIQQIINADENGQINQVVINIITLILYSILIFVGEYIFRQYSFIPFHPMQQKFTILRVTQFLLNLVTIVLELNNNSHFQHIISLILLHTTFVLKMLNHLYFKPAMPSKNIFHFKMSFLLESLVILISINVISENKVFQEQQISIYMLFIASLSYAFSESLFYFLFKFNQDQMIRQLYQIYELYSYISNITQNSITQYHLKIYQIINDPAYAIFSTNIINQEKSNSMLDYYKLGLFLITEVFVSLKEGQKSNYEELHMLFISFLAQIRNKPLVAYVEFKKFQNDLIPKSLYFKLIKDRIDQHLQSKVTQIQQLFEKKVLSTKVQDKNSKYNVEDFYKFFKIEAEFNKKVIDLAQLKISVWQYQIKGCKSIYDFEKTATPLSYKIIECIWYLRQQKLNFINESFIKQCDNLLILKVASVFNSFILNDYFSSLNCEIKIQELIKQDVCQDSIIVTKTSVIQDETILMVISIVKQFGNIICSNKSLLANYFGYELADFEHIQNINELMPGFFCAFHDALIQSYIKCAETKLGFEKYITFSLGKNRFLIPQYINIYNRFDFQDDFTLMGCLTKINEANHYLIFDEFGKLIGLTEQLSKILIPYANLEYFLTNIELFYIYMFVPHIHIYMNSILTNNEIQITQKSVLVYVFSNLREVTKMHSQIVLNYQLSQNYNEKTKVCTNSQQELANLITYPPSSNQNRLLSEPKPQENEELKSLQLSNMDFFKLGYPNQPDNQSKQGTQVKENEIIEFLNTLDILSKMMLMCTIKMTLASIGKKSQKLQYFILELSEFQEKNIIQEEEKKPKQQNLYTGKPVRRTSKIRQSYISQNQYQKIPKSNEFQIDLMSPVNSIVQKKSLLDKSPANSQILHYVSERRLNLLGVLGKEKSDSFSEEQQSDDVYVIHQQNKSNPAIQIIKSQSSAKSGSSGIAAVEIVNKFTKKTSLISGLTIISLIKLLAFILFFVFIFANLAQIAIFNNQAQQFFSDINLPMNLNKYFLNVFSFAWISALEKFQILQNSEFIIKQMTQQQKNMKSTFQNLTNMYSSFIVLEEKGFLGQLTIQSEQENSKQEVDYTYYIDFLQQIGFQLMYTSSPKVYLLNLLRFRINFETIITNNDLVMNSLNQLYHDQQTTMSDSLFKLILIEIILIDIILITQIIYWYKIEQYCQRVLLLSCRLTEAAAEEQIQKFTAIIQVMQTIVGQLSWKQQNCHKLCYTNYTKKERFKQRQSKMSNSTRQGLHFFQISNKNQNSKAFQTIPLNSRITETSVNFNSKIVFVFTIVSIASLFIVGDYMLFQSQTSNLEPAQQLATNYIQYSTNLDNSIAVALLIKTEQQLLQFMKDQLPEKKRLVESYIQNHNPVQFLYSIYEGNHSLLSEIYYEIIDSVIVLGEDESYCLTLYNDDFCIEFTAADIPFCERNLTKTQFIQLYGEYNNTDNNSDYLSRGIVGITTNFDTFLHQYYEYEQQEQKLNPDINTLQTQIQSQQFTNIVVQHYFDTYLGLDAFFNKIQSSTITALGQHMQQFELYQYLLGLVLLLLFIILTTYIIIRVNLRLICLRLLITLLPIEIMLNIHTISLLKILK